MVIETTLIRNGCIDDQYTSVLFNMDAINAWLPTSRSKPVVNLIAIERFNSTSLSHQITEQHTAGGMTTDMSQQSGFSHPQLTQPGFQNERLSQLSQSSMTHDPMSSLFWNRINSIPMQGSLDVRSAYVSNLMYSQGSQGLNPPNFLDFQGGHL